MRDKIFISHSTPADNEFSIWLASRLNSLGYDSWVDRNALIGGEKFWQEIDHTIRHKAAKLVLVYTKNICVNGQPGRLCDGIEKEYSLAESVAHQEKLKDFILLLNIDASQYNLFIGADRLIHFDFSENWANGLSRLVEKLEKDSTPKPNRDINSEFSEWYENKYITKSGIEHISELYFTNQWIIADLPDQLHILRFATEEEAKAVYQRECSFPIAKVSNILSSFSEDFPLSIEENGHKFTARVTDRYTLRTEEVLCGFESDSFPSARDAQNQLKSLLSRIFHLIMKNRKMFWYELADRSQAYYHTLASLGNRGWATIFYEQTRKKRKKRKALFGKYLSKGMWHYAVSCKAVLEPTVAFSLKSHIIFTDAGFKSWRIRKQCIVLEERRDVLGSMRSGAIFN